MTYISGDWRIFMHFFVCDTVLGLREKWERGPNLNLGISCRTPRDAARGMSYCYKLPLLRQSGNGSRGHSVF